MDEIQDPARTFMVTENKDGDWSVESRTIRIQAIMEMQATGQLIMVKDPILYFVMGIFGG
jgi:hypothetical protein